MYTHIAHNNKMCAISVNEAGRRTTPMADLQGVSLYRKNIIVNHWKDMYSDIEEKNKFWVE